MLAVDLVTALVPLQPSVFTSNESTNCMHLLLDSYMILRTNQVHICPFLSLVALPPILTALSRAKNDPAISES